MLLYKIELAHQRTRAPNENSQLAGINSLIVFLSKVSDKQGKHENSAPPDTFGKIAAPYQIASPINAPDRSTSIGTQSPVFKSTIPFFF